MKTDGRTNTAPRLLRGMSALMSYCAVLAGSNAPRITLHSACGTYISLMSWSWPRCVLEVAGDERLAVCAPTPGHPETDAASRR